VRIALMSDLHLEMHADRGDGFLAELDPTGVDILVLAGDVTMARFYETLEHVFRPLTAKYRQIIYLPGNHEYYRSSPRQVTHNLARLAWDFPTVHVLLNRAVTIEGQKFFGGTMWFPMDPAVAGYHKRSMNDFHLIEDFEPWVYEESARFQEAAQAEIDEHTVIVTHHLPAPQSIAPRYKGSALNAFFLCDMTALILERKPRLWIHGHTHYRADYVLGKTRIVCNPLGYPGEPESLMAFDPNLQLAVSTGGAKATGN